MTNTTHYSFQLPANFGSQNIWGTILNSDLNSIDTAIWAASNGTTIAVNTQSASANITLTNPLDNFQDITMTATGKNLILPAMNVATSLVPGGSLQVFNAGSDAFGIVAQDTSTSVVSSLGPGQTAVLTLLSGATANGTFSPSVPLNGLNNLSDVSSPSTSLNNLLPSQASAAGQFLSSDGTNASWGSPQSVLSGTMVIWSTSTAPSGYLECDGSAISRTTYATLFGAIGTVWGSGDGTTTFNIPDMRGYFPRGWAHGGSIDSGRTFATTQADAFDSHTHTAVVTDPGHLHAINALQGIGGGGQVVSDGDHNPVSVNTNSASTGITVTNSSTGGTETRPVNVAIMFIIKT